MSGLDANVHNLKGNGRKSSSPGGEGVRLYHHFREVWDSDIPKNYGYNYLDIESSDLPGINVMSGVSLEERANIEINTYFNEPGDIRIADNTYDLGSTSNRWRDIYTNDLHLSNVGHTNDVDGTWGEWTIQEGESDLFLKNNRSGKKYKFNLTEVL